MSAPSKAYISKKKVRYMEKRSKPSTSSIEKEEDVPMEEADEDEAYYSYGEVDEEELHNYGEAQDKPKQAEGDKKQKRKKKHKQEIDTNVVLIKAESFEESLVYATGDPFPCSNCKAIFNQFSQVVDEAPDKKTWKCEFCGQSNNLLLEKEEYPKSNALLYLLEGKVAGKPQVQPGEPDVGTSVIFCIDLSGSMENTQHYSGPKLKYMTSPFFITRLQCVKMAIDNQITKLQHSPIGQTYKVGFVSFDNVVTLLGDRSAPAKTYEGDTLDMYSNLVEEGTKLAPYYMGKPLSESATYLLNTLKTIKSSGATALGPALLISVILAAQGKPGSKVVICTDGLANKGLGNLETTGKSLEDANAFYTQVGQLAKEKGVIISIITLVEEGCRLDTLSPIANLTGGDILRVNPLNIGKDFEAIVGERLLATNVVVKVIIHKALQFRNEDETNLSQNKTTLIKDIGNATKATGITFEYTVKPPKELLEMKDIDLNLLTAVPLQSQISYKDPEGRKCLRVITQIQKVTHEKEEALKGAKKEVLGAHAALKTAAMAQKGNIEEAQLNAFNYAQLLGNDAEVKQKIQPLYQALEQEQQKASKEKKPGGPEPKSDRLAQEINNNLYL